MANILLIEPNKALARTYLQALQHVGYQVGYAADAQSAVNVADDLQPDVVVLELQLPGHDGIEFLHEFRSYAEWQALPVIILTSLPPANLTGLQPALEQDFGVRACLYKPRTSLEKLLSQVKQELTRA